MCQSLSQSPNICLDSTGNLCNCYVLKQVCVDVTIPVCLSIHLRGPAPLGKHQYTPHRDLPSCSSTLSLHSLTLVAGNWDVVDVVLLLLHWGCVWLPSFQNVANGTCLSNSFRHLSSCGILMTRTPRALCLQELDTMTTVPQSRNFISFTNKRKEYSERRIIG